MEKNKYNLVKKETQQICYKCHVSFIEPYGGFYCPHCLAHL